MSNLDKQITVTSPLLPSIEDFIPYLEKIWESKWITNAGQFHEQLEKALCAFLGVDYISVFTNGTLPLITALQVLDIKGEVITTPYSFVATAHSIWWNGNKPVFVDVDGLTGNIDPDKIEQAITPRTTAIMPVHVYGSPCDTERIQAIADKHGLKVIYDAAHAFGVKKDGISILQAGDLSTLSFHATKVFNTIEGGALICHSAEMKKKIDHLKNFGFEDEVTVVAPGINSKMDEVRAAYGLLNLKQVPAAIAHRVSMAGQYRKSLSAIEGISCLAEMPNVAYNYGYFPIFVSPKEFGMTRDELYEKMKTKGVMGRRYFYPLISSFSPYNKYKSSRAKNLPVATKLANSVICLPMHAQLTEEDVKRVIDSIAR